MRVQYNTIRFQHKKEWISVSLKYSSRKTVGIIIYPDKRVGVTAPFGTPLAFIKKVMERKQKWIFKQLEKLEKYQPMEKVKEYTSGQSIKILGRGYTIKIIQIQDFEEEQIVKEQGLIKVCVHDPNQKQRTHLLIEDWFRNEAMIYLAQKFEQCYERIKKYNVAKPLYYLRYMEKRWGSCTSKGNILLNPEIFQLPSHCIEYVIMHELCHLKYKEHSKGFYHFLNTVMPEWEDSSQALDSFLQV